MATPLTHIILSESIYYDVFSPERQWDFMVGTLLPDIRYLDKSIPRDKYHRENMFLSTVKSASTPFQQWLYFHSLLDQVRDSFYIQRGIYVPWVNEDFIIALKLLEDEVLYNKISDWETIIAYMQSFDYAVLPDIQSDILRTWYGLIINLMSRKPDDESRKAFMIGLWMPIGYIEKINWIVADLKKEPTSYTLIEELYSSFPMLIKTK